MGKSHRDNVKARKKIGEKAYEKKAKRRKEVPKCKICGNNCRTHKMKDGICPNCQKRLGT